MACEDCCEIDVCLNFVCATGTPEFKLQMKDLFENPCEDDGEGCCPGVPIVDGKIDMCLNGNTINVSVNACPGLKEHAGATCGACEMP